MKLKFFCIGFISSLFLFSCSKQSDVVTVKTKEAGTLSEQLSGKQWNTVKKLAIAGPLNELDIAFIKAIDINGLEELDLSKAEGMENLKFYFDSNNFSSITLPDNVKNIDDETFQCCRNLKEIKLNKKNDNYKVIDGVLYTKDTSRLVAYPAKLGNKTYKIPAKVKSVGNCIFADATLLEEIQVEEGSQYFKAESGVLYNKEKSDLIAYPAGKKDSIFTLSKNIFNVSWSAFWNCGNLKKIEVEAENPVYASIDGTLVKKHQENTYALTAFPAGRTVTSYKLPESICTIDICAFRTCTIDTLILNKNVYDFDKWAFNNSNIKEIVTAENEYFTSENGILYEEQKAYNCASGRQGKSTIKKTLSIDERALQRCSFEEITFGPSMIVGPFVCSYSKNLRKVTFEEGTTAIKGLGTFFCCTNLEEVEFPATLENISNKMFFGCINLKSLTVKAEKAPKVEDNAFTGVDMSNCTLYVPSKALEVYRTSKEWNMFKNIKPIL